MKSFIFTAVILVSAACCFAGNISGFIFDKSSNEPLPGVNVYISNTLWGSSTDYDGFFKIDGLPNGTHELVVSMIGYRVETRVITVKNDKTKNLKFFIRPVIYESDAIKIVAADRAGWYKNYNIFKDKFIGQTAFAKQCTVKNEQVLDFEWDGDILRARVREPLVVVNDALGYEVRCLIMEFSWDKGLSRLSWMSKNFYSELETENGPMAAKWHKNRWDAFESSQAHFFQWLKKNKRSDEFKLMHYQEMPLHILQPNQYYPAVADSIIRPGIIPGEHLVYFKNFLQVTVKKNNKVSYLRLNHANATLDEYGNPQEIQPFIVYGYWATLGIANYLPMYYQPEANGNL